MKNAGPEIHFVTGKGGVGKSVFSAALALKRARTGTQTLLAELGDSSFYQDFFSVPVDYQPRSLKPHLDVALWSGAAALKEYAVHLVKIEKLYNLFFENSVMQTFLSVAPGLHELSLLGKATSGPRHVGPPMNAESLIIDSFSTGHFLALLRAPKGMAEAVSVGPMGEQSRGILKILRDPNITKFTVVTTSDTLATTESMELCKNLSAESGLRPHLVLNKCLTKPDSGVSSPLTKDFYKYLEAAEVRQEKARELFRANGFTWTEIPYVFENDPWQLLEHLQGFIEAL